MYQEVHTDNIAMRAHAPEIVELLKLFEERSQGAPLAFEELWGLVEKRYGADMMVLRPTPDGDYVYEYFGREVARCVAEDRTGQPISLMSPRVARFTKASYDAAIRDSLPTYTIHRSLRSVRVCLWERLILPVAASDGAPRLVVFSRPMQFHEELLLTVLETSPSGIVALRAIRDENGGILRMVVITANLRAATIAGRGEDDLIDSDARTGLPFLGDPAIWQRCLLTIELRRNDIFQTSFALPGGTRWLQISLAPLGDGLVMTMSDITELMVANQTLQSRAATLALEIGRERATRRALTQEIDQREERERELRRLAETDPLTALLNRRSFVEKANGAMADADASAGDVSLIVVDLDHFKRINDTHGHAAGDGVIRAFADMLLGVVRHDRDLVGRFGGEEFAILLPGAGRDEAESLAERIQTELGGRALPVSESLSLAVSASFGVAARQAGESFNDCIERADRALYRAKREGRDCVRLADAA